VLIFGILHSIVMVPEFILSVSFSQFFLKKNSSHGFGFFWWMGKSAVKRRDGCGQLQWWQGWLAEGHTERTE